MTNLHDLLGILNKEQFCLVTYYDAGRHAEKRESGTAWLLWHNHPEWGLVKVTRCEWWEVEKVVNIVGEAIL